MPFYHISIFYMSHHTFQVVSVLQVTIISNSHLFSGHNIPSNSDPRLFCPIFDVIFPYLPEKILKPLRFGVDYSKVHKADRNPKLHEDVEFHIPEVNTVYMATFRSILITAE